MNLKPFLCTYCDREIEPFEKYLQVGKHTLCEQCVEESMEEYDPEGDYMDKCYDEMYD